MTKREFFNKKREEYISFYNYLESPDYCLYCEKELQGNCYIWIKPNIKNRFICKDCYLNLEKILGEEYED